MLFFVIKAKRMKFLSSIFGLKTKSEDLNSVENPAPQPPVAADRLSRAAIADRARQMPFAKDSFLSSNLSFLE